MRLKKEILILFLLDEGDRERARERNVGCSMCKIFTVDKTYSLIEFHHTCLMIVLPLLDLNVWTTEFVQTGI